MIFRNVKNFVEFTQVCKSTLFQQNSNVTLFERFQYKRRFRTGGKGNRQPEPFDNIDVTGQALQFTGLKKPLIFTVGFTTASLIGCAIWEYENVRAHASRFIRRSNNWIQTHHKKVLAYNKSDAGSLRRWWNSLKDTEKVFYPILAANLVVFALWRVRPLQPFMIKYFCSTPSGSTTCLPMLLSTFSHFSPFHLAANMYVLYSFMPAAISSLGKEQFVAMYLSGGVISSFASFLYKVALNQPGLSLGASGAIMSVLAYVCVQYPDTKLSIIFLPMYTFAAGTAIKFIMGIDLMGVVLGWKFFDHAAHLGGALFGIAWCQWGSQQIWGKKDNFLQYYHALRKKNSER